MATKLPTYDGNEEVCGACMVGGELMCCENCPAAFHFGCAGYAGDDDVPDGEWLCWSCAAEKGKSFPAVKPFAGPGPKDKFMLVSPDDSCELFYRARKVEEDKASITIEYLDLPSSADKTEVLSKLDPRIWHGTLDKKAWQVNGNEYEPNSRVFEVDLDIIKEAAEEQPRRKKLTQKPPRRKRGAHDLEGLADALAGIIDDVPPSASKSEVKPKIAKQSAGAGTSKSASKNKGNSCIVAESMVPKDYQEDPRAKAAFDAAFADFNKKQGRSKVPTCNIARDTQVEPYRLWWEVQAWGGVDKVAEFKLWATIGRTFRSPASLTTSSHQVKKCYEDTIAAFDEALRKGEYKVPPPKHIRDAAAFRKQIAREAGAAAAATTAANRAAALLGGDSPDLADLPSPASSMGGPDIKQEFFMSPGSEAATAIKLPASGKSAVSIKGEAGKGKAAAGVKPSPGAQGVTMQRTGSSKEPKQHAKPGISKDSTRPTSAPAVPDASLLAAAAAAGAMAAAAAPTRKRKQAEAAEEGDDGAASPPEAASNKGEKPAKQSKLQNLLDTVGQFNTNGQSNAAAPAAAAAGTAAPAAPAAPAGAPAGAPAAPADAAPQQAGAPPQSYSHPGYPSHMGPPPPHMAPPGPHMHPQHMPPPHMHPGPHMPWQQLPPGPYQEVPPALPAALTIGQMSHPPPLNLPHMMHPPPGVYGQPPGYPGYPPYDPAGASLPPYSLTDAANNLKVGDLVEARTVVDSMYCTGWMSARVKGVMEASPAEGHRRYLLQFVNSSNGMPPPPTPGGPDTAAYDQQNLQDWRQEWVPLLWRGNYRRPFPSPEVLVRLPVAQTHPQLAQTHDIATATAQLKVDDPVEAQSRGMWICATVLAFLDGWVVVRNNNMPSADGSCWKCAVDHVRKGHPQASTLYGMVVREDEKPKKGPVSQAKPVQQQQRPAVVQDQQKHQLVQAQQQQEQQQQQQARGMQQDMHQPAAQQPPQQQAQQHMPPPAGHSTSNGKHINGLLQGHGFVPAIYQHQKPPAPAAVPAGVPAAVIAAAATAAAGTAGSTGALTLDISSMHMAPGSGTAALGPGKTVVSPRSVKRELAPMGAVV